MCSSDLDELRSVFGVDWYISPVLLAIAFSVKARIGKAHVLVRVRAAYPFPVSLFSFMLLTSHTALSTWCEAS